MHRTVRPLALACTASLCLLGAAGGAWSAPDRPVPAAAPPATASPAAEPVSERTAGAADPLLQFLTGRMPALPALAGDAVLPHADTAQRAWQQARDTASDLVLSAMNYLGVPYRRGGQEASGGFDCSGFTRHVFQSALGIALPRRAAEQARKPGLASVPREQLVPGDLVFFNTMRRAFSHVGIYIGDGRFIHAPRAGGEVRIERMDARYWMARYNGARRAALPAPTPAAAAADPSAAEPTGESRPPSASAQTEAPTFGQP